MKDDRFEEIEEDYVESIAGEEGLYEHYRFYVDKGQALIRIDKYLVNTMAACGRGDVSASESR